MNASAARPLDVPEDWVLTPKEVTQWIRNARPGDRLRYASGRQLVRGATADLLRGLSHTGDVLLFQRRTESGGGFDYIVVRNRVRVVERRPVNRQPVLDPAMSALFLRLKASARLEERCPSDTALGLALGLPRPTVKWAMRKLVDVGLIRTRIIPTPTESKYRVVTIVETGLETRLPK